MSNIVRLARCRTRRTHQALFAQLIVKHVKHRSLIKSSNMQVVVLRATCCVVVNISRCFELRLVTNSIDLIQRKNISTFNVKYNIVLQLILAKAIVLLLQLKL